MTRTISSLLVEDKKVYLWMADKEIAKKFLQDAEAEGFTFEDGVKPTERHTSDIFRIFSKENKPLLCYVGWAGHMAFQAQKEDLIRIDYQKFSSGESDYIYQKAID